MTQRKSSRLEDIASIIDVRLGDILGQLGSALDEATEQLAQGEGSEIRRERQFDTGKGPVRASVGVRVRTLGGEIRAERRPEQPINTPKATPTPPSGPAPRMVDATVLDEPQQFSVIADVPGVPAEGVSWTIHGPLLRIEAKSEHRHYRIETDLPAPWQDATFQCAVQNGILELSATRDNT